jgi:hypothetical protein
MGNWNGGGGVDSACLRLELDDPEWFNEACAVDCGLEYWLVNRFFVMSWRRLQRRCCCSREGKLGEDGSFEVHGLDAKTFNVN